MQAIILAAGQGSRMAPLVKDSHKSLLKVGNESILRRLIRQLASNNITDISIVVGYNRHLVEAELSQIQYNNLNIKVVHNENYNSDTNILSLKLGLDSINPDKDYYIIEADTIFEEDCTSFMLSEEFNGKSIWFTKGRFLVHQYGGILASKKESKECTDIQIVKQYEPKFETYYKLIGAMRVGKNEAPLFQSYISELVNDPSNYYLHAWINNQKNLKSYYADLDAYQAVSFNTPEEYYEKVKLFSHEYNKETDSNKIVLVPTEKLIHIEGFSEERVLWLIDKIKAESMWTVPVRVEKEHNLVLDGQHRMEAALRMGLKKVPCISYNYKEIPIWSLRDDETVAHDIVISRALDKKPYPYKTVKHKFPDNIECNIPLTELT